MRVPPALAVLLAFATCVLGLSVAEPTDPATAAAGHPQAARNESVVRSYDLGVQEFPQPLEGRFAQMPIRLWGAIAVPTGPGPYPLVVVAHGAHGDNCPVEDDADTWPCFDREKRSDLGLAYLAKKLAARGMVVVVPDVNAAYTGGWGEAVGQESLRFDQVVQATIDAVNAASTGTTPIAGVDLTGKVDPARLGVLGHSRGGYNMVEWASTHPEVTSIFLLAPFSGGRALPDVPTTVTVGTCDGDTHRDGLVYARKAAKDPSRTTKVVALTATGANHNYFNRTLVKAGADDAAGLDRARCGRKDRPSAGQQQHWVARVAGAHFAATLLEPTRVAGWLKPRQPHTVKLAGISTLVRRY